MIRTLDRDPPKPSGPFCRVRLPAPALRLFCFPFAGAGAAVFRDWLLSAELGAEIWALCAPGRETRRAQTPLRRLDPLLDDYVRQLEPLLDRPFAFFGHSMGALVAFETVRRLASSGAPLPAHMFLGGCRAPDCPPKRAPMSALPDDELLVRLLEMAGPSRSAIRDPGLLLRTAPVLRADLELCERYRYEPGPPLAVPVTCFAAVDDSEVDLPDVAAWLWHTRSPGRLVTFTGGHLFLHDHRDEILREIAYDLVGRSKTDE